MVEHPGSFLDSPTPIAFAHRGYAAGPAAGAQNTMAAFEQAVTLGYRYLETDVRVTADGDPVVFHDPVLEWSTDGRGRISALPTRLVRRARVAGAHDIPLLADLLAAWPDVRVNLDIKADNGVRPTVQAIQRAGAVDRVCIGAFSSRRIEAARRELGGRLCTALGPRDVLRLRLPAAAGALSRVRGRCAQVPVRIGRRPFVDARYLRAARRLGLQVHVWTVNDRAEMERLLDLGVDGLMTDRGELLRDVLVERGQWPATRR